MSDQKTDDRPLAEREEDAVERFHDLETTAHDLKDRLDVLDSDVTGIEAHAAALSDQVFELTVQRSGAMDLISGPLSADDDVAAHIGEIVEARAEEMHGPLADVADELADARSGLIDLETDLADAMQDVDVLEADVHAIRAEGGVFDPDAEARAEEAHEMDDHLQEMLDSPGHAPEPTQEHAQDHQDD